MAATAYGELDGNGAADVTFPDRYGYVSVTNLGTAPIWARADGTPAVVEDAGAYVIPPGDSRMLANGLGLWYQSSRVLAEGSDNVDFQSRAGQEANPGTSVSIIGSTASTSGAGYVVEAAG